MFRSALTALAALAAAAPALGQDPASTPDADRQDPPPRDRIVVTGERPEGMTLHEYAHTFVLEIGDPATPRRGFARFEGRVCVGVENVPEDAGQYIADRISQVALEVGLTPGGPGCRPNIAVVFASDGAALASYLVDEAPRVFRPFGGVGGTTQGLGALREFKSSDAAVRWWQITMVVDELGNPAIALPPANGFQAVAPSARGSNSRITNSVRDELWATYIIVDASRLDGAQWRQLADYLAMVALAQVNPGSSAAGYESILNLFTATPRAQGMTDWDRTYLRALYDMDTMRDPRLQRGMLVNLMVRDRRDGDIELE
jgi:hypothetical protein